MWQTIKIDVSGKKYTACLKRYDEGSNYGIGGGRISKLQIKDENGRTVVNYDRGWDIRPQTIQEEAAVLGILEDWN